jgi:hypothetical protein
MTYNTRYADAASDVPDGKTAGVDIEPHVDVPHPGERITADQNPAWSRSRWYNPARSSSSGNPRDAGAGNREVFELSEGAAP